MRLSQPQPDNAAPSECTAPEAAKARKHPCVAPAFSRRSSSTTPGRRACRCRSNSTATRERASTPPLLARRWSAHLLGTGSQRTEQAPWLSADRACVAPAAGASSLLAT
jgi:hypothetical protein